jgi:hypothetical protein
MPDDKKLHELWNIIAGLRLRSNEIHDRMNENEDKFVNSGNSELMRENFQLIEEQVEVSRKTLELLSDYQNMIKESQI